MHSQELPNLPSETAELLHAISKLSNREADQRLAQAETARRAEIDAYWAQCQADPVLAAQMAANRPPIVRDLALLASSTAAPGASDIGPLFIATARLLAVKAVRDSLIGDFSPPAQAEQVNRFWEDSLVAALRTFDAVSVVVLRYGGTIFNPGTVPGAALTEGDECFVVCQRESDGNGGEIELVTAYVFGTIDAKGNWKPASLDLQNRSDLMRDLKAMESLVDRDRISNEYFNTRPLTDFPTRSDLEIAQLNAHKAQLRRAGEMPAQWQAIVKQRTSPLLARMERLRRRMKQMEDEIHRLRCSVREVEACALEEETYFARGAKVRHKFTCEEGVLEIVNFGGKAQFRLCNTTMYVTEDIRRGEWELAQDACV